MGKGFFYKTVINVNAMTLFMTIIPIPKGPILDNDILGTATITSILLDKVHVQNINVEVKIITKLGMGDIQKDIFKELGRGVTQWKVTGGYTGEESNMLFVALSKYEVNHLKRIVHRYSPNAFIVINEKTSVYGNYLKKL